MLHRSVVLIALISAASDAAAADRATCKALVSLLGATDRGLAAVAAGTADKLPAAGIATSADGALSMAASFSTGDPLPDAVTGALTAMGDAARTRIMLAAAAPALLEQGLIVQHAMPDICPGSDVPDLARHGS